MAKKEKSEGLIPIDRINFGGLSDSKFSGIKHSLYKLTGWDPHSTPGLLKVAQKMTAETTGTEPTELCKERVNSSNGSQLWFSLTTGKIWERPSSGTWRLVHTTTPEAGGAGCLGAIEFDGWIYWLTEKRVHRITVADADDNDWANDAVEDWKPLNLDQTELGGTGQTYALTTSINEGATHKQSFVPVNSPIEGIAVNVGAKGTTADWTLTVHDSANASVGTSTVVNANLAAGWIFFNLSAVFYPVLGATYHIHLVATNTTGTPTAVSNVASDLEGGNIRIYTTSNASFHPTNKVTDTLYIGDREFIHQIAVASDGSHTFTREALDIQKPLIIKSLGQIGTDLLIGTWIADTVTETRIIRWNTWSESFTNSDPIPEVGINAFLPGDNVVLVQAGLAGRIYSYNGEKLELFKTIPGDYSPTATAEVYPSSVANIGGDIYFGVSNVTGNPCDQGIYRLGRNGKNYPYILDFPYPISERSGSNFVTSGLSIGGILAVGSVLYASWKNDAGSDTYGVDKLDFTAKLDGAYFETMVLTIKREQLANFSQAIVPYFNLPASTDIDMYLDINHAGMGSALTTIDDTQRMIIQTKDETREFTTLRLKVKATCSSNSGPEIESAGIFIR